jgi:hypothetical protein
MNRMSIVVDFLKKKFYFCLKINKNLVIAGIHNMLMVLMLDFEQLIA